MQDHELSGKQQMEIFSTLLLFGPSVQRCYYLTFASGEARTASHTCVHPANAIVIISPKKNCLLQIMGHEPFWVILHASNNKKTQLQLCCTVQHQRIYSKPSRGEEGVG